MNSSIDAIRDASTRLTVFLANYNHGKFLAAAIEGLLCQTVTPMEIWLADDASTDESRDIIARYAARHSVIKPVLLPENRGVVANMANFLADTDAEYVFFAASDDLVMPDIIEQSLRLLLRHPEAGLCSSLCRLMDENDHDLGPFRSFVPPSENGFVSPEMAARLLMQFDSWVMGNTTVYKRNALRAVGGFDPSLHSFTDGFATRAITLTHGAVFVEKELAYWRQMDSGLSSTTNTDPDRVHQIADRAMVLMSTTHCGIFPPAYGERWRHRWFYGAVTSCLHGQAGDPWPAIDAILSPASAVDRAMIALSRRTGMAGKLLFKLYAIFRLRALDALLCLSPIKLRSSARRRIIASRYKNSSP